VSRAWGTSQTPTWICQRPDCDRVAEAAYKIRLPYRPVVGSDPGWTQEFWYCIEHEVQRGTGWVTVAGQQVECIPFFELIGDVSR